MKLVSVCACRHPISQATFVEELVSSPSYGLGAFVKNQVGTAVLIYTYVFYSDSLNLHVCFCPRYWGFELRASCFLSKHFTTCAMPPAHVALVIFQIGFLCFPWTAADHDPPTLALICCNYRCWPSCPSCSLRWSLHNFLLRLSENYDLPISTSQVAWITGISHCAWPQNRAFLNEVNAVYYRLQR
jgi:hypothetical protein